MKLRWILAASILGSGIWLGWRVSQLSDPPPTSGLVTPRHPEIAQSIARKIAPGDVVFRGRKNSWGELGAKLSDKDQRFGHVGIVTIIENRWHVIDAAGHPNAKGATVAAQPLEHFLFAAERAAIYRPNLSKTAFETYQLYVNYHAERATPFDDDFSIDTPETLYCTELVWRALKTAINTDPVTENTQWRGKRVIAIDDLQFSPYLTEVMSADILLPNAL